MCDLRHDAGTVRRLAERRLAAIEPAQGTNLARALACTAYVECSSLTGDGVAAAVEKAVARALPEIKANTAAALERQQALLQRRAAEKATAAAAEAAGDTAGSTAGAMARGALRLGNIGDASGRDTRGRGGDDGDRGRGGDDGDCERGGDDGDRGRGGDDGDRGRGGGDGDRGRGGGDEDRRRGGGGMYGANGRNGAEDLAANGSDAQDDARGFGEAQSEAPGSGGAAGLAAEPPQRPPSGAPRAVPSDAEPSGFRSLRKSVARVTGLRGLFSGKR
jgi:hypothetical protein